MQTTPLPPYLGQHVFYVDEERIAHPAIITGLSTEDIDYVSLVWFKFNGYSLGARKVKRANHNGSRWILNHRWFVPTLPHIPDNPHCDNVPLDEFKIPGASSDKEFHNASI